jgi:hypothetical protein
MRGRIVNSASLLIGRPFFWISIVTMAPAPSAALVSVLTDLTVPTLTPAIRTGDFALMSLAVRKAADTSKLSANGFDFVKPK